MTRLPLGFKPQSFSQTTELSPLPRNRKGVQFDESSPFRLVKKLKTSVLFLKLKTTSGLQTFPSFIQPSAANLKQSLFF